MSIEFKENIQSYSVRIIDDIRQLEYLANVIRMNQDPLYLPHSINHCHDYLKKIAENLSRLEDLLNTLKASSIVSSERLSQ